MHKNLLLYTKGEAKFSGRYCLYPAMVRSSQVAARLLSLRNLTKGLQLTSYIFTTLKRTLPVKIIFT
jgi:hypothetical protein